MSRLRHVAVIVDAADPYDRKIISGVAAYVKESGNWSLYVEVDPLQKLPVLHAWHGHGIIASFDDRKVAAAVRGLAIPVVGLGEATGGTIPRRASPTSPATTRRIARLAAEHLLDRGFRRLAFYGYPRTRINGWSEERARAFKQRADEAGIQCSVYTGRHETAPEMERPSTRPGRLAPLAGEARGAHGLQRRRCPARAGGLPHDRARVPDDVAVIGVDNDETICDLTNPPLSSVEQGARRMGYEAAALLDKLMSRKKPSQLRFVVEPEGVVVRRSTDTLAIEDPDMASVVRFIRDHACDGISVYDVVRQVAISRSTLENRFKSVMGRTVHAEIEHVRLERARELIAQTVLPLKQVAAQAGFRYVQYMTKLFRMRLGQTPAEFRNRTRRK